MPSASTYRPMSASYWIVSSLCSRTRPVSVTPTARILPLRLGKSALAMVRSGTRRFVRGAQGGRHFGTRLKALVRILGERAVDDLVDRRRQVRANGFQRRVRIVRDLVHERGHRVRAKRQLAAGELV